MSGFNIGFEFEICTRIGPVTEGLRFDKLGYEEKLKNEIPEEINLNSFVMHGDKSIWDLSANALKQKLTKIIKHDVYKTSEYQYTGNEWYIKFEDDMKGLNNYYIVDNKPMMLYDNNIEISTKVYDLDDGILILKDVFEIIKELGYTNSSTGLHISIDQKGCKKYNQSWLKIASLFDDIRYTSQFGRENNPNNKTLKEFFSICSIHDESAFRSWVLKERSRAINFTNDNYYEFRVSGGKDYEYKFESIKQNIYEFCDTISKSNNQ